MGKSQRVKGATGEREVAHLFQDHGFLARRGMRQTQDAGGEGDVVLEDLPQVWLEVKRGAQTRPIQALLQAELVCKDAVPFAICRNDHEKHTVIMRMKSFDYLCGVESNGQTDRAFVIMEWGQFITLFKQRFPDAVRQQTFKI
jgi:hypothetical protein